MTTLVGTTVDIDGKLYRRIKPYYHYENGVPVREIGWELELVAAPEGGETGEGK